LACLVLASMQNVLLPPLPLMLYCMHVRAGQ